MSLVLIGWVKNLLIKLNMNKKWDRRFLDLALHVSTWSKDPSTKVGAVIVNEDNQVISLGYNGFPRGVADLQHRYDDRPTKYLFVAHAERNALDNAFTSTKGATLYTSLCPCNECAKSIIQKGIKRVVTNVVIDEEQSKRLNYEVTLDMFEEANINLDMYEGKNRITVLS
jgi:dCMP deaminase